MITRTAQLLMRAQGAISPSSVTNDDAVLWEEAPRKAGNPNAGACFAAKQVPKGSASAQRDATTRSATASRTHALTTSLPL
mmetsp:Transcript_10644/g.28417  ORF Transcript_10644/g.28417 Transcript_10644/m.28417 type:complete len:81 (+) Transcript_10644:2221-2463(+)